MVLSGVRRWIVVLAGVSYVLLPGVSYGFFCFSFSFGSGNKNQQVQRPLYRQQRGVPVMPSGYYPQNGAWPDYNPQSYTQLSKPTPSKLMPGWSDPANFYGQ